MVSTATPQVYFDSTTVFNAGSIIDKTLIAKKKLTVYNSAGLPVGFVAAGQPAGVVYSYLDIKPGVRDKLTWQFSLHGNFYYIPHEMNAFDVSSIKKQGVLTLDEIYNNELAKIDADSRGWFAKLLGLPSSSSVASGLGNVLLTGGIIAGAVYLAAVYIKKKA